MNAKLVDSRTPDRLIGVDLVDGVDQTYPADRYIVVEYQDETDSGVYRELRLHPDVARYLVADLLEVMTDANEEAS